MLRPILGALGLVAAPLSALAAPPPPSSEEARRLHQFGEWFAQQAGALGLCCTLGDGRMVEARIRDGRYEVRFLHPETITTDDKPQHGVFYPVAERAVLRGSNPTGAPIAWWSGHEIFINGDPIGRIRCFIGAELY